MVAERSMCMTRGFERAFAALDLVLDRASLDAVDGRKSGRIRQTGAAPMLMIECSCWRGTSRLQSRDRQGPNQGPAPNGVKWSIAAMSIEKTIVYTLKS